MVLNRGQFRLLMFIIEMFIAFFFRHEVTFLSQLRWITIILHTDVRKHINNKFLVLAFPFKCVPFFFIINFCFVHHTPSITFQGDRFYFPFCLSLVILGHFQLWLVRFFFFHTDDIVIATSNFQSNISVPVNRIMKAIRNGQWKDWFLFNSKTLLISATWHWCSKQRILKLMAIILRTQFNMDALKMD